MVSPFYQLGSLTDTITDDDVNCDVILASGSPRRRMFLANMGLSFKIVQPNINETVCIGEYPVDYVCRMAREKAEVVSSRYPYTPVIAADTIVVLDGYIIGKPVDRADAKRILQLLSGRTHEVITAVYIKFCDQYERLVQKTKVTFAELSDDLIDLYVATGECDDKSGAYALQGYGAMLIEKVEGSVSSVVGLPVCQVRQALEKFGVFPHPILNPQILN